MSAVHSISYHRRRQVRLGRRVRRLMLVGLLALLFVVALPWVARARSHSPAQPLTVTIHTGDTLWDIATQHHRGDPRAYIYEIEQLNHLDGGSLQPGQILYLPSEEN